MKTYRFLRDTRCRTPLNQNGPIHSEDRIHHCCVSIFLENEHYSNEL